MSLSPLPIKTDRKAALLDFRPPEDSPFFIWLLKALLPAIMKYNLKDARLEVSEGGVERFHKLRGVRTVICPNHPSPDDPQVMFAFSKMVGEDFNYLAAREVFDWDHGLRGWCFQRIGCYSVVRGAADRESFKTTRRLIVEGRKKLVIFPEGEISRQNDTLMPLESGVAQMSFWALDELNKINAEAPVCLLPIAIKYTYRGNIRRALEESMARLEQRLSISPDRSQSLYARLRAVAERILAALEQDYSYRPPPEASLNDRIGGLRSFILRNIAGSLQLDLPASASQLDQVRVLRNTLDDFIYADEKELSAYERKIHEEKESKIRGFYRDLDRVVNFISIYDGYLRDHMTQERFADVINRLEAEVFGHSLAKGPRLIRLSVGSAINLLERYPQYKANKRETLHKVTDELYAQIDAMLKELDRQRQAVFVE